MGHQLNRNSDGDHWQRWISTKPWKSSVDTDAGT